jgi:very-short-patch-repair endonuclease
MTLQERKLWDRFLRRHPIRFLRQRPIDHFIIDFYCARCRIGIEIDGLQHSSPTAKEYDRVRSDVLSVYKIEVLRFTNREIDEEFGKVCDMISKEIFCRISASPKQE